MFERIILPIDKSNKSLTTAKNAIKLAKKLDIKVTAIYTINPTVFSGSLNSNPNYINKNQKSKRHEKQEKAHDFLNKIETFGDEENVNVQTILMEGDSEKKIINEACKDDLIIIGTKDTSTIDRIFLSSLNEKLVHNAPSTVMIFRQSED
jgi:nucleotide-binding universal stress UspA family protein